MTTPDSVIDVTISGSGPYGFRLSGGEGQPLVVNKLRQQSKACSAGLKESDILLGINGYNCQQMKHAEAMSLLENTEFALQLIVFRSGDRSSLSAAYDQMSSRLRPLSPSALPPHHQLPPPPPAGTGSLVIDQPTYLRRHWAPPALQPVHEEQPIEAKSIQLFEQAPQPPPPSKQQQDDDRQTESRPGFFVATPLAGQRRTWAPPSTGHQVNMNGSGATADTPDGWQPVPGGSDPDSPPQFHVNKSDAKPWVWQPTERHNYVRMRVDPTDVEVPPIPDATFVPHQTQQNLITGRDGRPRDGADFRDGGQDSGELEVIPRWALPLRSEYDWRSVYYWMSPDEFDFEITDDGQYLIRKKKVFTDSSFYDDPAHRYPTIEEQIKMARKVAQSLTSAGNVKARGQRMFMRRKEKADRWTIDSFMPPSKRGAATPTGVRLFPKEQADASCDSDGETLYYNPEPWAPRENNIHPTSTTSPWAKKIEAPKPATPAVSATTPLTWKPSTTSFAAAVEPPPRPLSAGPTMQRKSLSPTRGDMLIPMPKHTGKVPPSVAFGLAHDMRSMKGKGGRMFAQRRAKAAADEREDDGNVETQRQDVMRRIAGSFVSQKEEEEEADSSAQRRVQSVDVMATTYSDMPPSASRLQEMIERSRGTTVMEKRPWNDAPDSKPQNIAPEPARNVEFSSSKNKGGFRPVRYRAPLDVMSEEVTTTAGGGISDF